MSAPVDLPALKLAQDAHLTLGDSANMRDCVGRVLPFWSEGDPLTLGGECLCVCVWVLVVVFVVCMRVRAFQCMHPDESVCGVLVNLMA